MNAYLANPAQGCANARMDFRPGAAGRKPRFSTCASKSGRSPVFDIGDA